MNIFQIKNESRSKTTNANGKTESLHVRASKTRAGWQQSALTNPNFLVDI
jgi:hypothetical protein